MRRLHAGVDEMDITTKRWGKGERAAQEQAPTTKKQEVANAPQKEEASDTMPANQKKKNGPNSQRAAQLSSSTKAHAQKCPSQRSLPSASTSTTRGFGSLLSLPDELWTMGVLVQVGVPDLVRFSMTCHAGHRMAHATVRRKGELINVRPFEGDDGGSDVDSNSDDDDNEFHQKLWKLDKGMKCWEGLEFEIELNEHINNDRAILCMMGVVNASQREPRSRGIEKVAAVKLQHYATTNAIATLRDCLCQVRQMCWPEDTTDDMLRTYFLEGKSNLWLEVVHIDGNSYGDAGLAAVARTCPNLLTLELCASYSMMCRDDTSELTESALAIVGRHCRLLEKIELEAGSEITDITTLVQGCTSLKEVWISRCAVETLSCLGVYCPNLLKLQVWSCPIKNDGVGGGWNCPLLETLELDFSYVDAVDVSSLMADEGITSLFRGCPRLKNVLVKGISGMTDAALQVLSDCACLESLWISDCDGKITDGATARLIKKRCAGIRKVFLFKCRGVGGRSLKACGECLLLETFGFTGPQSRHTFMITDTDLEDLANCKRLESIVLNGSTCITDDGMLPLVQSCRERLRSAYLVDCIGLTDVTIEALSQCELLEEVNISGCSHVTDRGLIALAQNCHRLRILRMKGSCGITDHTLDALQAGCLRLEELDAVECNITPQRMEAMERETNVRVMMI